MTEVSLKDKLKKESPLANNFIEIYESFKKCETRKLYIGQKERMLTVNHEFHQASEGLLTATYDNAFNSSSNSDSSSSSSDDDEDFTPAVAIKKLVGS